MKCSSHQVLGQIGEQSQSASQKRTRCLLAIASLSPQGIISGHCSCPVGGAGRCKHAAALLLTWLHEPEAFHELEALETNLAQRSKGELVALISKMIGRYPDLEMLLELPSPGDPDACDALDADLIRRQVNVAFSRAGDDWRSDARAS